MTTTIETDRGSYYLVDTSRGAFQIPMALVGTHADREGIDQPFLAPREFHEHLPVRYVWSIKLINPDW